MRAKKKGGLTEEQIREASAEMAEFDPSNPTPPAPAPGEGSAKPSPKRKRPSDEIDFHRTQRNGGHWAPTVVIRTRLYSDNRQRVPEPR